MFYNRNNQILCIYIRLLMLGRCILRSQKPQAEASFNFYPHGARRGRRSDTGGLGPAASVFDRASLERVEERDPQPNRVTATPAPLRQAPSRLVALGVWDSRGFAHRR